MRSNSRGQEFCLGFLGGGTRLLPLGQPSRLHALNAKLRQVAPNRPPAPGCQMPASNRQCLPGKQRQQQSLLARQPNGQAAHAAPLRRKIVRLGSLVVVLAPSPAKPVLMI